MVISLYFGLDFDIQASGTKDQQTKYKKYPEELLYVPFKKA